MQETRTGYVRADDSTRELIRHTKRVTRRTGGTPPNTPAREGTLLDTPVGRKLGIRQGADRLTGFEKANILWAKTTRRLPGKTRLLDILAQSSSRPPSRAFPRQGPSGLL
jgi:hypothetical protein